MKTLSVVVVAILATPSVLLADGPRARIATGTNGAQIAQAANPPTQASPSILPDLGILSLSKDARSSSHAPTGNRFRGSRITRYEMAVALSRVIGWLKDCLDQQNGKRGLASVGDSSPSGRQAQKLAASPFIDVPLDHWAWEDLERLIRWGTVVGYPDHTFRGDRAATRYEAALLLSRTPAALGVERQAADTAEQGVLQSRSSSRPSVAAALLKQGFIHPDSPLLKNPTATVTLEDAADAIASVAARIIELRVAAMEWPD